MAAELDRRSRDADVSIQELETLAAHCSAMRLDLAAALERAWIALEEGRPIQDLNLAGLATNLHRAGMELDEVTRIIIAARKRGVRRKAS